MRISDWSSDVCSSDLNTKHRGGTLPWWTWGAAALGLAAIVWLSAQPATEVEAAAPAEVDFAAVENVVLSRCSMCHAAEPLRSEEHTSELQSLMRISYAVFCLKKKT